MTGVTPFSVERDQRQRQLIVGLVPNGSSADDTRMAYIIERNARLYVVAYDGIDPLSGRERRRWHPAGRSRADAEAIATALAAEALAPPDVSTSPLTFGKFLSEQWMPRRRPQSVRAPRIATGG